MHPRIVLVLQFSLVLEGFTVYVSIHSKGHNSVQFLENTPVYTLFQLLYSCLQKKEHVFELKVLKFLVFISLQIYWSAQFE